MHRHVVHNSKGDTFVISYEGEIVVTGEYARLLETLDARGVEYTIEVVK